MSKFIDIVGKKFGRLTVINRKNGKWFCACECGGYRYSSSYALTHGKNKSCGCLTSKATYGNRQYSIDIIRRSFENEGYMLLSKEYKNTRQKLKYMCPDGHVHEVTWSHWNLRGHRCPTCKFINMSGASHWNWKGGKSTFNNIVHAFIKNSGWSKKVFDRDGQQMC